VQFAANITDTVNFFDIYINIRNTNDYPRQNLFLFVQTTSPHGNSITDTIDICLADNYGRWTGKKISRIWENNVFLLKNVQFADKGNYVFEITQGMRYDILNGISDLGLCIEHTK
jgi:gliding motility-associated lipoprotein GldH